MNYFTLFGKFRGAAAVLRLGNATMAGGPYPGYRGLFADASLSLAHRSARNTLPEHVNDCEGD